MNEFLAEYGSVLRGLVRNEKAQINMLSMLAEDNRGFAEGIVRLIEQHILNCPPPAKLPALYLVDSIIKNVGEPYKSKFGERMPEVFGAVWDTTLQEKRSSLSRLYGTWTGVLSAPVLARVQNRMVSTSGAAAAQQRQQQQQPRTAPLQPGLVPQPLPVQQQQQLQPIVQMPAAHVAYALPGQLPGQQLHVLQQQPQLLGPQQFMGLHQQPTFMQIGNNLVPVMPQQILQPIPLQHAHLQQQLAPVQHNTPQHMMQAVAGALPPVSPAHPGWVAQQQQQQQQQPVVAAGGAGPMVRRSPASPAVPMQLDVMRGPPPPAAGRSSAGQQQVRKSGSPMPSSGQLTSDALSQLLSNLAGTGVLAKGGGVAAEDASKVQKVKDFQSAFLKETHPGVLHLLEQLSLKSRAKFRDVEYQRNKRRSAAAGAGASRPWYLTVDVWIAGTLTTEDAVANNPFGDEAASDSEQEAEALEPEDPEQPCCAISGEPFEKFFDQDKEEWFYRGVKRIHADEAERYGVADGSLVKVKCLAEAGLGSGAAAMLAAGGTGQQQQEADAEAAIAAAAAGAPAAGQAASEQQQQQQQQEAAADGDQEQEQQQQEQQQDDQQHAAAAVVKQESQDDAVDFKSEALQDSKMEDAAAAAAQQVGTKREASSEGAVDGQQGEPGSAAKRAKLEQAA